jgi:metal-responsive CopG/Arc/MetJ family transcriptional regulator
MANKLVTSVSLPAEVLKQAGLIAKETHKSRSELIKEAVLQYLEKHEWHRLQEEAAPYATAKGVRTEDDVENLVREVRRSPRKKG